MQNATLGLKARNLDFDRRENYPRLGNDVTIGPGASILGNVVIGEGATIGANAVVLKDVPPGCRAVGNPARILSII